MMEGMEWRWLNEPAQWHQTNDGLQVVTDQQTDFWRSTWYGFERHSGHLYGCEVAGEFTFQVCVEGEFTTLYDQAGLMLLQDDEHWLKAGIEYNDAQPMIGSVLTNPRSDWATGIFPGWSACLNAPSANGPSTTPRARCWSRSATKLYQPKR